MTLITQMEILNNYPENTLIDAAFDGEKYSAWLYLLRNGDIHKPMLSTQYIYDTPKLAIQKMTEVCESVINSND